MKNDKKINNIIKILLEITDKIIIYNNIDKNFILEKTNKNKKIKTINFIKNNRIIKENLNKEISKEYRKDIIHFFNIINKKLSHCNFENLNNNINTLKIKNRKTKNFFAYKILGLYLPTKNKVFIDKKNYKNTINHELLHMASCRNINRKYIGCGFEYMNKLSIKKFGTFINEGYTELLNKRYFTDTECYKMQRLFANLLEIIIGKELLEKMFFNADLIGLINELTKYNNSKEEVINFIINTDIIHNTVNKFTPLKRIKLKKALIEVNDFLIHTYYEKIKITINDTDKINYYLQTFIDILNSVKIDINHNSKYIKNIDYYKEKKLVKN